MKPRLLGMWKLVLVATALAAISVAQAQGDTAMTALVSQVATSLEARLPGALPPAAERPLDLAKVRIRYLLSTSLDMNAVVEPGAEPTEERFRLEGLVVCLAAHPLLGGLATAGQGATAQTGSGDVVEFSVFIGERLIKELCESDPARLAVVIGHELGHLCLGHHQVQAAAEGRPRVTLELMNLTQQHEFEADAAGIKYAQAAGFADPVGAATKLFTTLTERDGDHASIEPASAFLEHPSNAQRIAELQTDPVRRQLWRALLAFDDGVTFLSIGDWEAAEGCFSDAGARFGESPEVKTNLGYARMMRFYAGLPDDAYSRIQGEVSCASYVTSRPAIRGGTFVDTGLLKSAIEAFREARALNAHFYPARASLGTALAMDPNASPQQLDEAIGELGAAAQAAGIAKDQSVQVDAWANLALAQARRDPDKSEEIYRRLFEMLPPDNDLLPLKLNFGLVLAASEVRADQELAERLLTEYLKRAEPSSYYARKAASAWTTVRPKLTKPPQPVPAPTWSVWTPSKSVVLPNGRKLTLHQDVARLPAALADYSPKTETDGAGGQCALWSAPKAGLTLRGFRGRLTVIVLDNAAAPRLELRGRTDRAGTGPKLVLQVGKPLRIIDNGEEREAAHNELDLIPSFVEIGGRRFSLYPDTQVAVAWDADDRQIAAIALVSG